MDNKEHREVKFDESQANSSRDKYRRNVKGNIKYEFTGEKCGWDVNLTAYTEDYEIDFTAINELKDRDISYQEYFRSGYMIEKIKQKSMYAEHKRTGCKYYLIIYFQDGVGWWCDLEKIDWSNVTWKWRLCTKSTAEGTYGEEKVWKLVYDIPPSKGNFFKYE